MLKKLIIGLIKFYQYCISPLLPNVCRFRPSCSEYFIEAVKVHGAIRGSFLGIKRLLRCHPWGGHGDDPVPLRCLDHTTKVDDSSALQRHLVSRKDDSQKTK